IDYFCSDNSKFYFKIKVILAKKKHYRFNSDTLSYEIVNVPLGYRLKKYSVTFLIISLIAAAWIFAYSLFFNTPKEVHLLKETNRLLAEYDIISRKLNDVGCILDKIMERDNKVYRAVFEEDSIPYTIRNAGFGGSDRYAKYEDLGISNSNLLVKTYRLMDILHKKAYIQSKSFDRVAELAANKTLMQRSMPVGAPIFDLPKVRLASVVGYRKDPVFVGVRMHEGIDLAGSIGIPIYAAGDGIVLRATFVGAYSYGNLVEIDHGFGYITRYGHLSKINVEPGQKVFRGDKVGELGNTGKSVGPHLHYEIRLKGSIQNPLNYFKHNFDEDIEECEFVDQGDGSIDEI
ncbi:MAG: M23 family metallopeptidase, partial [Prevotellaceae bacterium]|nr:M23 family metallopeptidase [Prevotellaceae bacterium]